MRIGIIRHFKVNYKKKLFMTSKEFKGWEESYNNSKVTRNDVKLHNINWDKCYSSTLSRAITTAEDVYSGKIVKSDFIREVPITPLFKTNLKLPYCFWAITSRLAWYFNFGPEEEKRKITETKAKKFIDFLENEAKKEGSENILIVTHGFFMYTLQKELKTRGFKGKTVYMPKNGILYLYKKF